MLFLLSFLSYLMRQNIHVAGEFMMPELGISEIEMGWIYAAFIWGYALCQLPGGVFGKLLGPRVALTCAGCRLGGDHGPDWLASRVRCLRPALALLVACWS